MIRKTIILVIACFLMGNKNTGLVNINQIDDVVEVSQASDPNFESIDDHNHYIHLMADELGVEYSDLFSLIVFETAGTMDPKITNPHSGARGLLQFTNSTARTLKNRKGKYLSNAIALVNEYPTFKEQMELPTHENRHGGPVYQYLARSKPYANRRELFLTVFYPSAIKWSDDREFPPGVQKINPGIVTVGDYVAQVDNLVKFTEEKIYD